MTTTPPVIFIIFNEPDRSRQVFETIRAARPSKLLMIADGPRPDRPGEAEKCAATRTIVDEVDWECEVHTNFSETNIGARLRISSGITWAFELVEKAIILEHDCVPSASFFPYCADLLDRYENDERVMMVSGNNYLFGHPATTDSYYFSRYVLPAWGWATWRRAWAEYDLNMSRWPEIRDSKLFDQYFPKMSERYYWETLLQSTYDGIIDTWDYQWVYSIWANSGLCAVPARNLVRNIGFHAGAMHTIAEDGVYSALGAEELGLPLTHPATLLVRSDKDELEARLRPYRLHNYGHALKALVRRATGYGQNR